MHKLKSLGALVAFAVLISLACLRAYRYPQYSLDGLSYMANVVAMKGASIREIHETVYREAQSRIPAPVFAHLTGNDPAEPITEANSARDRAVNPYHFAEYLPCFAIRPGFTELLYVLHYWLGVSLLKAVIFVPVVSFWLLGWIILAWTSRHIALPYACIISFLVLLTPPMLDDLARGTTPDSLSTLVMLASMFLLFEQRELLAGLILLIASVYIRTDNVLLVILVLAFLYLAGFGLRLWHVLTLSALAAGSVVLINHFSGDYGARMLYYRIAHTPSAVGEIAPTFGLHQYLAAVRVAAAGVLHGAHIPFLLMGIVGLLRHPPRAVFGLAITTMAYTMGHLILYPVAEPRYFGVFFAAMGIVLATSVSASAKKQAVITELSPRDRASARLWQAVMALL